jgi:hypothetical protein
MTGGRCTKLTLYGIGKEEGNSYVFDTISKKPK